MGAKSPAHRLLIRSRQLTLDEWQLLAEAFVWLAIASAAIRTQPFLQVGRMASSPLGRAPPAERAVVVGKVRWAVKTAARWTPWRAVCFQQGLTAQIMLRRRGVDSTLYFGAAPGDESGMEAHVWVRDGERDVVGVEEAKGFAVLARFPSDGHRN